MSSTLLQPPTARPLAIARWLYAVASLVFVMVVVGGITRLTESGLSIVHWDVVTGTLPPLNEAAWQAAFDAYRTSPQYLEINRGMSLDAFKEIYFWEYVHRLLGRVIGFAFALPLAWFAWKRAIPRGYGWRLVALLALGGLQGAIGWWMVASGLVDRPDVSHIRLAVHLLTALFIFAGLIWTALDLMDLSRDPAAKPVRMTTPGIWTLSILALQMLFGAYVAGLDAGYAYSSWPKMGDEWFPSGTPMLEPFVRNFVDNPIVVQFVHRWLAFAVAIAACLFAFTAWDRGLRREAVWVIAAVTAQILLGIGTLLTGVDIHIAVAHQGMGALLLAAVIVCAHRLGERRA
ncbi:COX15/CtaA family protein [Allosphingosinicella indica]|uniref:Heme A synthase n=1 Tax=Allosphingosinicella indica TaxID=941907 RepID=A0A1X7GAZ4_9SPHN|nr:COX15/CtaA family protein [Allosphingosinicella indica]SMF66929.1 cytochrome c oxidase assembly protein subunit 15 [Allosphingosinicella indica]